MKAALLWVCMHQQFGISSRSDVHSWSNTKAEDPEEAHTEFDKISQLNLRPLMALKTINLIQDSPMQILEIKGREI